MIDFIDNSPEIVALMKAAANAAEQAAGEDGAKYVQQTAPRTTGRFAENVRDVRVVSLPESDGGGVAITNSKIGFWGMYLEFGTKNMRPQPSFGPMMNYMEPKLQQYVAQELAKALG